MGAVVLLDGHLELLAKLGLGAEIAGIQKVKDRPEIEQAVFDGGAREGETVVGFQLEDGFGLGSFGVFDVLGFVEDDAVPGDAAEQLGVFAGEGEGGDYHVMVAAQGFEGFGVFGAIAAVMHHRCQFRRELFNFVLPVAQHRRWPNQQRRGNVHAAAAAISRSCTSRAIT